MEKIAKLKKATYHLWAFVFSKLISSVGNSVYAFGMSLYILESTGSATGFAINLLCGTIPRTIFSPVAGLAADRFSKKVIVLTSQSFSIFIVMALLLHSYFFELNIWAIYVTTACLSVSSMFTSVTFTSSIANLIDEERIQKAIAFNQTSVSISTIGGPMLGGFLYGMSTMSIFLIIHMASFMIAIVLEATMNFKLFTNKDDQDHASTEGLLKSLKGGYDYIRQQRLLWTVLCTALIINFFSAVVVIGMPFIAIEQLEIKPAHFGVIEGAFSVGIFLASLYLSVRKEFQYPLLIVKRGIIFISIIILSFIYPLMLDMSYVLTVVSFVVLSVLYGITNSLINTPIGVIFQKHTKEAYRGRVFGMMETMAQALSPISIILFGFLFDTIGALFTIIPTSIMMFSVIVYLLRHKVIVQHHPNYEPKWQDTFKHIQNKLTPLYARMLVHTKNRFRQ
ncbi:MFS transporter [Lentibacillus saliphilus]|uniref:MFS transporter n=1 Tax=Lentibacillus saliphilus TaxID=2737028 RepID=UPI001C2F231B